MPHVGNLLVDFIFDEKVKSIVDLGCGSGSLTVPASLRWPDAEITTVDIDGDCEICRSDLLPTSRHQHLQMNVLTPDLRTRLPADFDLALCNPPFIKLPWIPWYAQIVEGTPFEKLVESKSLVSAEVMFIAQNIELLKERGLLALILPDTLVSGLKSREFRKTLLENFGIDAVVQLPRGSFSKTEARSFLLVVRKLKSKEPTVPLYNYDAVTGKSDAIIISKAEGVHRLDYRYYTNSPREKSARTLSDIGAVVNRGNITAASARDRGVKVFHTTDFASDLLNFDEAEQALGCEAATAGDILLARVGRSLHLKVAKIVSGSVLVTDCVYIIRTPKTYQDAVFRRLRSDEGAMKLKNLSRGVGAAHLPKSELMSFPIL
ncbi:N-6 DNA methylase [Agrobacterium larrymoorei]|uniref:N-6 DNA methylase n=1 Tax=Agrobacterium larrymoorei TaxID=160699 RepID=UPI0030C526E7